MNEGRRELLCSKCRKRVSYHIVKRPAKVMIKGLDIEYEEYIGICDECGEEIYVPGMDDQNEERIEEIYRKKKELITIPEIKEILEKYHIDKRPLSKLLGFGELTITRYIDGQLPSKKYSDILFEVLKDENKMRNLVEMNKEAVSIITYNKVSRAINECEKEKQIDSMAEKIAAYVIKERTGVNNLFLQRMLYYIKALGAVQKKKTIIPEQCVAEDDGPVFPTVYKKYEKFGEQEITTNLSKDYVESLLTDREKEITNYVLNTFGICNNWFLGKLIRSEEPWKMAREEMDSNGERNSVEIDDDEITNYFSKMNEKYDFNQPEAIYSYVKDRINTNEFLTYS